MKCLICQNTYTPHTTWSQLAMIDPVPVICDSCEKKLIPFNEESKDIEGIASITCFYQYNPFMKELFHQYKFLQDVELAKVYAPTIRELRKRKLPIVPIPLHPEKLLSRTFSQVDELLREAKIQPLYLLEKSTNEIQGEKSKVERLKSANPFTPIPNIDKIPKEIILFDDILTTGTTLKHAADTLNSLGIETIHAATLIHA